LEEVKKMQSLYSYFPYEAGTHFHHSFSHLRSYGALYYTYLWSQAIAKDLFTSFKKHGILNSEHAIRYRDSILRPGGSKDADRLIAEFLGRPFNFQAFSKWLTQDASQN